MAERQGKSRRPRRLRTAAAFTVLLTLAGYMVVQYKSSKDARPHCVVRGTDGEEPFELEPEMAHNAATIVAVAAADDLPERAVTIALATAIQESGLRNIDYGDRDSVGLFQQRPSQDWGTVEQIMDPVYSAGMFYERLLEIQDYHRLPLTDAAQRVQRSGFPQAYAKHEARAAQLSAALTGRRAAAFNCMGNSGKPKPGDAARIREKLIREFGQDVLSTKNAVTKAGTADAGRSAPSDAMVLPVPADTPARRGWELAHWAMANASGSGIETVTYGNHVWDAKRAAEGWRKSEIPADATGTEVRLTFAQEAPRKRDLPRGGLTSPPSPSV